MGRVAVAAERELGPDRADRTVPARQHARECRAACVRGAVDQHRDHARERGLVYLEQLDALVVAGSGDEPVDRPERALDLVEGGLDGVGI